MRELAKLSLTSKNLREFCISIPFLTFDGMVWKKSLTDRMVFINFVDRFFALRKGMETQHVSIRWPLTTATSFEKFRVFTWLYNAIGCKVQWLELEFILKGVEVFSLPISVYHCKSLKKFEIDLHRSILEFPSSGGFYNLKSLSLRNVRINNDSFGEWISSFCKHLEELLLDHIDGVKNIMINSSTLERLTIDNPSSSKLSNIIISAEKLTSFSCFGEIMFKQGCLPSLFCNLSSLIYTNNLDDCLVPAIASLLKGTPNLKTLTIKYHDYFLAKRLTKMESKSYGFTLGYWESQNLAFVHKLEKAAIELFHKGDNELELIKYLLKHATSLKKMAILYSSPLPSGINREVDDYEKAPTAEIVFFAVPQENS
ncbi:hypothetical protein GH714_036312 [Hevea brasiliensis]|uniref:Uncharacterized protein n=1 Tax=Hevea brasiliensis TaxID=3981 RepID=A0A6A6KN59_HEVBR|nr:hypothetical protein GH714_036312 [Hevea brasiliensis]